MQQPPPPAYVTYLIPLVAVALILLRNGRARRLRVEQLWITPVMILLLVGLALSQAGAPTPAMIAIDLVCLVAGAALGWWRGRLTHITVDPATHELTSRTSPIGMLLILGIFALRYGLRAYALENPGALPVNVIADALLVVTVGIVCAQRLEIALRATRLVNEARAASTP